MWLTHHSRICLGKESARTHDVSAAPPGSSPSFQQGLSWGLGLLGQTRKPLGRVRLSISRVLVRLSMMHAPTPVMRVKRKSAHDIALLTTVEKNTCVIDFLFSHLFQSFATIFNHFESFVSTIFASFFSISNHFSFFQKFWVDHLFQSLCQSHFATYV